MNTQEKIIDAKNGMPALVLIILSYIVAIAAIILGAIASSYLSGVLGVISLIVMILGIVFVSLGWILFLGIKVLNPQEALALTLFGQYVGTIKSEGIYFVNPFCVSVNPASTTKLRQSGDVTDKAGTSIRTSSSTDINVSLNLSKKISLKEMTLSNNRQKINDFLGNPVEISIAVIWKVTDTAKAVFSVDNYKEFLSLQCDASLRNVVRLYPYDVAQGVDTTGDGTPDEGSLRGSSDVVAERIKQEIQSKVTLAGIEVIETKITYLAYAQEIAAAMLQRQQASALIDAKKLIVDGAVGMVEMALARLEENDSINLDEERKAAMVSNLLVVLCANKDSQPVVNTGSLY